MVTRLDLDLMSKTKFVCSLTFSYDKDGKLTGARARGNHATGNYASTDKRQPYARPNAAGESTLRTSRPLTSASVTASKDCDRRRKSQPLQTLDYNTFKAVCEGSYPNHSELYNHVHSFATCLQKLMTQP